MITGWMRPWVAGAATALVLALALQLPPDGAERGPAALSVLGKWHLLLLHIPAGLLVLLPVAELLLRERTPSRALRLMGDLAAAGTWLAAILGILHAHHNGFAGQGIEDHLWLGVASAALAALTWALFDSAHRIRVPLQVAAALCVAAAGHVGGELVHGEGFLTNASVSMAARGDPAPDLAGLTPAERRTRVYETQVRPLLARHCTPCHDSKKQKGKLRMDSIEAMEKGGSEGPALVWGKSAESLMVLRSTLPREDDASMPPEPRPMLAKDEVEVLRAWIDGVAPTSGVNRLGTEAPESAPTGRSRFPSNAELRQVADTLSERHGLTAVVRSLGQDAGLRVAAHAMAGQFDDAALARLADEGLSVAELDLSRCRLTDGAAASLARFRNLEVLVLNETQAGDAVARAVAELPHLHRLAMRESRVTDEGLASLTLSPSLQSLYIGRTQVTPQGAAALRAAKPRLQVVSEVPLEERAVARPPTKEEMKVRPTATK